MRAEKKLERLEVRLRTTVADENELILALSEQEGTYGGMNELMRQCVMRGFMVLKSKMQNVSGSVGEVGAIDALAQAIIGGEYDYRVINTYLHARQQLAQAGMAADAVPAATPIAPAPEVIHQRAPQALSSGDATQAALAAVAEEVLVPTVVDSKDVDAAPVEQHLPSHAADAAGDGTQQPPQAVASKPKHDWKALRAVAGSTGAEKGAGASE